MGSDGRLYVAADTEIAVYDGGGERRGTLRPRDGAFKYAWGLAVRDDGTVCVVDCDAFRVVLFRGGEEVTRVGTWGSGDGQFGDLRYVCALPGSDWLVADCANGRVVRLGEVELAVTRERVSSESGDLGQANRLLAEAKALEPAIIMVNAQLSPVQQRNLEKAWGTKVLDRTALILEIFGERAATREGRLQVELAHLTWQRSRLVRSWTHLERQRGGFGFLGGPGETQI